MLGVCKFPGYAWTDVYNIIYNIDSKVLWVYISINQMDKCFLPQRKELLVVKIQYTYLLILSSFRFFQCTSSKSLFSVYTCYFRSRCYAPKAGFRRVSALRLRRTLESSLLSSELAGPWMPFCCSANAIVRSFGRNTHDSTTGEPRRSWRTGGPFWIPKKSRNTQTWPRRWEPNLSELVIMPFFFRNVF